MSPDSGVPGAESRTDCPTCQGELVTRTLECRDCGTRVELPTRGNEFADLDAETLHLLRIFVLCEGRIRDMEAALGVSYPTVKSRLSKLREALGLAGGGETDPTESSEPADSAEPAAAAPGSTAAAPDSAAPAPDSALGATDSAPGAPDSAPGATDSAAAILEQLERGAIAYEDALRLIRDLKH